MCYCIRSSQLLMHVNAAQACHQANEVQVHFWQCNGERQRECKSGRRPVNAEHTFSEQNWGSTTSSYFQSVANCKPHILQGIVQISHAILQDDSDDNSSVDDPTEDLLEGEVDAWVLMLSSQWVKFSLSWHCNLEVPIGVPDNGQSLRAISFSHPAFPGTPEPGRRGWNDKHLTWMVTKGNGVAGWETCLMDGNWEEQDHKMGECAQSATGKTDIVYEWWIEDMLQTRAVQDLTPATKSTNHSLVHKVQTTEVLMTLGTSCKHEDTSMSFDAGG
ncbi:hypothetical protein BKA83DRAFT_4127718 [Pisolithus microcarpus]|nr:hypothetical protein BKA83DRAFT_4127718 [Pisolithus microcarpus]